MTASPTDKKSSLRAQGLRMRSALAEDEARAASEKIIEHLLLLLPLEKRVACYLPVRGELDLTPAMEVLAERGQKLCLPVVVARQQPLIFREWAPGDPLERGDYDIDVPLARAAAVIPDEIIAPLACFDAQRHRIGYGGGYYDRTIHALRATQKLVRMIGVGYACQQVDKIPAEEHDERLDEIVTEEGILA